MNLFDQTIFYKIQFWKSFKTLTIICSNSEDNTNIPLFSLTIFHFKFMTYLGFLCFCSYISFLRNFETDTYKIPSTKYCWYIIGDTILLKLTWSVCVFMYVCVCYFDLNSLLVMHTMRKGHDLYNFPQARYWSKNKFLIKEIMASMQD